MPLALNVKFGDIIHIGPDIRIKIARRTGYNTHRIHIEAPRDIGIRLEKLAAQQNATQENPAPCPP